MENNNSNYLSTITKVYIIIFSIAILTAILGCFIVKNHGEFRGNFVTFQENWVTEDGKAADLKHLEKYGTVMKTVPNLESDQILFFHTKSINIQVYLENILLYETDIYDTNLFGKTPGSYYVQIPIKREYAGKQIIIKADSPYHDNSGKINEMFLGNGIDIILNAINEKVIGFIVSVIIAFFGFLFVIVYFPLKKIKLVPNEMLYLGLFSMNIGIYMLMDCGFLNIMTGQGALVHMIAELWMMFITIPLMCYLDCKYPGKNNKKAVYIITIYSMAVFLFCYTAHWMNWLDYHQLILLTHIGYVLVIIYFSYCVIRKMMMKTTKEKKHHLTGPIFIFLGVLIDIINLNFDSRVDNSMFTRIGVLVFFILEGMQIIEKMIRQYKEGIKLQFVSRLAYHDGLTDLLNRTSFMEEQDKIEKEHSFGLIAMFDVNDLKKMNDNYGHTKGDELIITVAHAIQHIFGELGKCYRIGGDEFVLLSHKSCTEEQFLEKKKMLPDYLKKQSEEKGFPISVAIGYTVYDEEKHHCFHDFLNEADNLMYEDKKRIKEARA